MDNKETISDEEKLYRSVRGDLVTTSIRTMRREGSKLEPRLFVIETKNRPLIELTYANLIPLFLN